MLYVLSLPEATGLYLGLALQYVLRASALGRWAPVLLMLIGIMTLLSKHWQYPEGPHLKRVLLYVALSTMLLMLFWPEASRFGRARLMMDSSQVASYTASQDPQATVLTAGDLGEGQGEVVIETPGFRLILHAVTDFALAAARTVNREAHRPFSTLVGMSWFVGMELTSEVTRDLADWIEGCWKPVLTMDMEFQDGITSRQLLPWGDTPVARALASRSTIPGSQTGRGYLRTPRSPIGSTFLSNPGVDQTVRCDVYLAAVELAVQRWLFIEKSPNGTPLSQVFAEDLGKSVQEQARWLIYREMIRLMGRPVPAPSLTGAYAGLTGTRAATGALGAALGAAGGNTGRVGGWWSTLFGGGTAVVNQFDGMVQAMLVAVGLAQWFVYWSPVISGITLHVLVGLFPFLFLWSQYPDHMFRPLILYFITLTYVLLEPLWLAMVDLLARWGASIAPQSPDAVLSTLNWAPALLWSTVATILGLVVVHGMGAALLYAQGRNIVSSVRH
jgi:hypothetical protein